MKIINLMPTRRWWNWPIILANILAVRQVELIWMPVLYQREWDHTPAFAREVIENHPRVWKLVLTEETTGTARNAACCHKLNQALDRLTAAAPNAWVHFGADDTLLPLHYQRAVPLLHGKSALIYAVSLERGQPRAASGYETFPLIAAPENMKVYRVSGEQVIVHTSVLQGRRFLESPIADGMFIEALHDERPGDFRFVPDFYLPFNAIEEGRWTLEALREVIEQ